MRVGGEGEDGVMCGWWPSEGGRWCVVEWK